MFPIVNLNPALSQPKRERERETENRTKPAESKILEDFFFYRNFRTIFRVSCPLLILILLFPSKREIETETRTEIYMEREKEKERETSMKTKLLQIVLLL